MDERVKKAPIQVESVDKELLLAFRKVASMPEGVLIFRHMMEKCGYKEPSGYVNLATGEIPTTSLVWNEARRDLWLTLRKSIPKKQINIIEMER